MSLGDPVLNNHIVDTPAPQSRFAGSHWLVGLALLLLGMANSGTSVDELVLSGYATSGAAVSITVSGPSGESPTYTSMNVANFGEHAPSGTYAITVGIYNPWPQGPGQPIAAGTASVGVAGRGVSGGPSDESYLAGSGAVYVSFKYAYSNRNRSSKPLRVQPQSI